MPLMYLPLIMFASLWESMLQPFGGVSARAGTKAAKVATRRPRTRDIEF
jgi:hypothetical protein